MRYLSFLATFRDTLDTLGASKAAAVRVIDNVLGRDAVYVHSEQFCLVEYDFEGDSSDRSDHGTGPHVTNTLIRVFLMD